MPDEDGSITGEPRTWKDGERDSVRTLWEAYFHRVVGLARGRLDGAAGGRPTAHVAKRIGRRSARLTVSARLVRLHSIPCQIGRNGPEVSPQRKTPLRMTIAEKLCRAAETDSTFRRVGADWVGKCLICNGPIAFDADTGEGATLEHIRAKSRGGDEGLENLAVVHGRCNWEKGRRWDPRKRRSDADYDEFVSRLLRKRSERWRSTPPAPEPGRPTGPDDRR